MDTVIYNILPTEMQQLVQQIEERIGREIGIRPLSDQARRMGNVPAIQIEDNGRHLAVDLMLPPESNPAPHIIAHEILHAKHAILDGAPMLQPKIPPMKIVISAINNDSEHLHVIPAEIMMFPEAKAFWERDFTAGLHSFADRVRNDRDRKSVRNDLLRFMLVTSAVLPDWNGHDAVDAHLRNLSIVSDANNLRQAYASVSGSKEQVLSTLVRFHRLRTDDYIVCYAFAPPAPLPAHKH